MGDGGYDHSSTYIALENQQQKQGLSQLIKAIIPPNIDFHKITDINSKDRAYNYEYIENKGRFLWQKHTNYGKRSLVENIIHRYKSVIGNKLRAKNFDNQLTEIKIAVQILNKMMKLGIPKAQKSI